MVGSCSVTGNGTSGDVASGQSEGLSVTLLQLIYLNTWSVRTLGEAQLRSTGGPMEYSRSVLKIAWNVLEGF